MKQNIRAYFFYILTLLAYRAHAQQVLPDNIYADTAFAPFYYGVASGDPLQDRVIIWTKVFTADSVAPDVFLKWEMADDSLFRSVIASGNAVCSASRDYTTKADVTGLQPGHHYYYRFITKEGKTSQIGRAQTLPPNGTTHFKLALVSCSSVWSGYFNGYRRIAGRNDIDFVVHVGDYVYDFVDKQEQVRVPEPYPQSPVTLTDWRDRHKYYLLDPDLRAARQNKTWIAEWDNHDTHLKHREKSMAGVQAFYEYLPIRMPDTTHPERIYRTFHFGGLADINMIDMYLFRGKEEYAPGQETILGNLQDTWLKNELQTSAATWHLIGCQEMMGSWLSEGVPKFLHLPGNGKYFDPSGWDEADSDRNRLYHFLDSNHINNFVVMSGDMHMSYIIDLTPQPKNKQVYNKHTGKGAVGVEVLGPSITRGNMAERGIPKFIIPAIQSYSLGLNPHHRWCQFSKHGYVTLDVTPEKCTAEFWYTPILYKTDKETFGRGFVVKNGVNHWERRANKKKSRSTYTGK
jgi:alkaline phosphatase D